MSATSALENSEDLENVPFVRMEDVQPKRFGKQNVQRTQRVTIIRDIRTNDDKEYNICKKLSVKPVELTDCGVQGGVGSALNIPEVDEPIEMKHYLETALTPNSQQRWPTLEILPGGVIKDADKFEEDILCTRTNVKNNVIQVMLYACAKCSESFDSLVQLVKHVRLHDKQRKRQNQFNKFKLQTIQRFYMTTCKGKIISDIKSKCKVPKKY